MPFLQLSQMMSNPEMEKIEAVLWLKFSKLETTSLMVPLVEALGVGAVLEVAAPILLKVDTAAVELVIVREDVEDEGVEDPEEDEEASVVEDAVVAVVASRPKVHQLLPQQHLRLAENLKLLGRHDSTGQQFPFLVKSS